MLSYLRIDIALSILYLPKEISQIFQSLSQRIKIVEELFTYPTYSLLVENIDKIQNFDDYKNEFKNKLDYKKTKDE